jgi:RHS repeat-associated protein
LRTSNRYDGFGVGVEKIRSDGQSERSGGSRAVDALGRVRSETDQRGGVTTSEYTADGLLGRRLTASGQETRNEYDQVTRRLSRSTTTSPIGPPVTTAYTYEATTGRLLTITDASDDGVGRDAGAAQVGYTYDAFGNTTEIAYGDGRAVRHRYDEHGRRVATTDAAGLTTVFTYDAIGQLGSATQHDGDAGTAVIARVAYTYDEYGRVTALERDTGTTTRYTFTSMGDVASETTTRGSVTIASRDYTYTPGGELASRVDRAADASGELAATTTVYGYDAFGRLRSSSRHDGGDAQARMRSRTDYDVSVSGDVAAETVTTNPDGPGEQAQRREFAYSPVGELTTITTDGVRAEQSFDAAGNLVRAVDGTEYTYDAANRRLSRTADGRTAMTSYWADGARRGVEESGAATRFYWDGPTLLTEDHEGAGTASYLIAAGRHARTVREAGAEPVSRAYDSDRHGSVVGLLDDDGVPLEGASYSDYGVPAADTGAPGTAGSARASATATATLWRNPFGFAGEYTEPDGTQPLGDRVYDPHQLRFQTKDVAARHNLYAFGALNPVMHVDPTGRTELSDRAISWIGTGFGAAAAIVSLGMAIATAGWSLSIMGVIGVAAESAALGITAAQVVDEFMPTVLEGETESALNYAGIGLGFLSFGAGAIAVMDASNWAGGLMKSEQNFRTAVARAEMRVAAYDKAGPRLEKYWGALHKLTGDGELGADDVAQATRQQAMRLRDTASGILSHLENRAKGFALVNYGTDGTELTAQFARFTADLAGQSGMLSPLLRSWVLARAERKTNALLTAITRVLPDGGLMAVKQNLADAANEYGRYATRRLRELGVDHGEVPVHQRWLREADDLDATGGGKYPAGEYVEVSGSESDG